MKWRDGLTFEKDPDSTEPRGNNWTKYLAELSDTETITASTWAVSAALTLNADGDPDPVDVTPLTLASPSIVTGSQRTQVKYTAGTVGQRYKVTNHITTSGATIDDRSFYVVVRQR